MANEVRVLITADDKASATIKNVAVGIVAAEVAMKAFTAAAGGLKSVVSVAAEFEKGISSVGAVSGATKEQLKGLSATALQIGKDTQFGAREAAGAMEVLASNGITATDIMGGAAKAAATLAAAGGTDLALAADTVSTAMSIWGASTQDLTEYVNRLAGAANVSRFGVEDMSAAIAQGGGVAAGVGVEFSDFTASIAATAQSFSSGSDAGTSFKTFLQRLSAPTKEASGLMRELGINAFDSTGKMRPMGEIVEQLNNSLGHMSEAQRASAAATIFGSDAMRTALGLAGMTREEFEALSATMKDTSAQDVAAERTDNLAGAWERFKGSIETIQIEIGQKLSPKLKELADWGAEKLPAAFAWLEDEFGPSFREAGVVVEILLGELQTFGGWLSEHEEIAKALADGIALATVGMIAFGAASLAASLVNPFTATIIAIEALTVLLVYLVQNWDDVEAAISAGSEAIAEGLADVGQAFEDLAEGAAEAGGDVIRFFEDLPGEAREAVGDLGSLLYDAGADMVDGLIEGAQNKFWDLVDEVQSWPEKLVESVKSAADGHSPWGIAKSLGEDFVHGIAVGFDAAFGPFDNYVGAKVASLVDSVMSAISFIGSPNSGGAFPVSEFPSTIYGPAAPVEGPFIGMTPAQIAQANRDAVAAIRNRASSGGGSGSGGSGGSGPKKSAAEELADSLAEATRNASLTLAFGDLGAKAMEAFLDAFETPSKANSLPGTIAKIVADAKAAGVPQAEELGQGILNAMLDAFAGTGSIDEVKSKMNDLTLATTGGIKNMVTQASAALSTGALTDSAKKSAEKALRAFTDAIASGEDVPASKLRDFIDKLTQDSADGFETLKTTTVDKLEEWIDSIARKLQDGKPETSEQLRSMLDGLESILKSAPLPDSMRAFADSSIDAFLAAIKEGKGIALSDLDAFIKELIDKAKAGAAGVKAAVAPPEGGQAGGAGDKPTGPGNAPVGANGVKLVWDPGANAWVYPWEVGLNDGKGNYGDMAKGQAGQVGGQPLVINMPNATINARDKSDAERSMGDLGYGLMAGLRARGMA